MDLFTVDTTGEHTLSEQNEYNISDILYSYSKRIKRKNAGKAKTSEEQSKFDDIASNEDVDIEEDYDYKGI